MKYIIPAAVLLILSSCIHINSNGYYTLSKKQRAELRPFSIEATDSVRNQQAQLSIVEIKAADVRQIQHKYHYTWLHYWIPYCKSDHCYPLYYYERIERAHRSEGLKYVLLSQVYDRHMIVPHLSRATLDRDIYVPKDAYYGHGMFRARDRFMNELLHDPKMYGARPMHSIFRDTQLVYYGSDMSAAIMDSILKANP